MNIPFAASSMIDRNSVRLPGDSHQAAGQQKPLIARHRTKAEPSHRHDSAFAFSIAEWGWIGKIWRIDAFERAI
jgi:hypothetical protein